MQEQLDDFQQLFDKVCLVLLAHRLVMIDTNFNMGSSMPRPRLR